MRGAPPSTPFRGVHGRSGQPSDRSRGAAPSKAPPVLLAVTLLTMTAYGPTPGLSGPADPSGLRATLPSAEPISPVPSPAAESEPVKLELGERLFRDARLSRDGSRSCASCHDLERGGADRSGRSPGADGRPLDFNAPSVFNAALNFRLNWRGNFRSLEEQAEAVLLDRRLMGTTWDEALGRLRADPGYRDAFARAYGAGAGPEPWQVLDALSVFQRSLLTPDARFDRWLRGERGALTPEEERGYALFKSYGCVACHQGVNVGGNLFQRFGVFAARPVATEADLGRFAITGEERDRRVFRVPSLRNVAATAPYFHDGGEPSLAGAVGTMARSQLGRSMTEEEIELVVRFLRTLTGEYRGRPVAAPEAPDAAARP
jgi:cytochrome c peroxidase